MKVTVSTALNCSASLAWNLVEKSSTLVYVAWPLAHIESINESFPERWTQGSTILCRSYLFGFIPVGTRQIFFEKINSVTRQIQTRESDTLVKHWDHLISIIPNGELMCIYSDEVEIDAGIITPLVWLWANWFYKHRQSRWKKILKEK